VGFDRIADTVKKVIDEHFDGDGMKYAKKYYETVARLPEYGKIDVVAHFDLICKHREKENFFDTESKKYRSWALEAMEHLNKTVGVFEVNTGAVARGYRTTPYPDTFLLKAMKEQGAKMTVSSDCHDNTMLDYLFDESLELLRSVGFSEVYTLGDNGFVGHKI
jgi:histidinol-phosphatase (PHP family)